MTINFTWRKAGCSPLARTEPENRPPSISSALFQTDRGARVTAAPQEDTKSGNHQRFSDGLLDNLLTIEENLKVRGSFTGKRQGVENAVKHTAEITGNRISGSTESHGRPAQCDIARALINTPKILFLDEPTTGLDPQTRKAVWDTITEIQKKNEMTVFFTNHYMEEAVNADYEIIIDNGRIAARGTPSELKENYSKDRLILSTREPEEVSALLDGLNLPYIRFADSFEVALDSTLDSLPVIQACRDYLTGFEVVKGTMDDAFIAITGKEMRE